MTVMTMGIQFFLEYGPWQYQIEIIVKIQSQILFEVDAKPT